MFYGEGDDEEEEEDGDDERSNGTRSVRYIWHNVGVKGGDTELSLCLSLVDRARLQPRNHISHFRATVGCSFNQSNG